MADMLTVRAVHKFLRGNQALEELVPILAEAMDEAFERGLEKVAPKPKHSVREPPPWDTHPANKLHFLRGDLILPATNETDEVALYKTEDNQFYLACDTEDGVVEVKLPG